MGILMPCLSCAQAVVQHKTTLHNGGSHTTASKSHDHTRRCNLVVYGLKNVIKVCCGTSVSVIVENMDANVTANAVTECCRLGEFNESNK